MKRLLMLLWLALAASVHAEPYLAVEMGMKCVACHVNPTGGGLRNAFGAIYSQQLMAAHKLPDAVPTWTGGLHERLRLGANLRAGKSQTRVPSQATLSQTELSQLRAYLDLQLIRDHLGVYLDQQLRPGRPQRQEAYVRLTTSDQRWYAKAGQFYLPFGWRLQDNTSFVRSLSGFNMANPDKGLELGYEGDEWSVQIVSSNGPGNVGPVRGDQLTGQAVWNQPAWRVGMALARTNSSAGDRTSAGVFGGLRTGPVAWLGEVDLVSDGGYADGKRRQLAMLGEANWKLWQGHNLKFSSELLDPDRAVSNDHKVRYSLVYETTPIPFTQLRAGYRHHGGIPQNNFDNRRMLFVELHLFL
jgi:hypothetical protein